MGYRYFDANNIAPLFPFGHGLSYTSFSYTNLAISTTATGDITVDFDVTNSGSVAGAEVAQVYVGLVSAPVPEPPLQLKGFEKLALQPQQTGHAHFLLDRSVLTYWDVIILATIGWPRRDLIA